MSWIWFKMSIFRRSRSTITKSIEKKSGLTGELTTIEDQSSQMHPIFKRGKISNRIFLFGLIIFEPEKGCYRTLFQYRRNCWNTEAIWQSSNYYFWSTECDFCSKHFNCDMAQLGTPKYISFIAGVWASLFIQRNLFSMCTISRWNSTIIYIILDLIGLILEVKIRFEQAKSETVSRREPDEQTLHFAFSGPFALFTPERINLAKWSIKY